MKNPYSREDVIHGFTIALLAILLIGWFSASWVLMYSFGEAGLAIALTVWVFLSAVVVRWALKAEEQE